jgi:hypothetical protein
MPGKPNLFRASGVILYYPWTQEEIEGCRLNNQRWREKREEMNNED